MADKTQKRWNNTPVKEIIGSVCECGGLLKIVKSPDSGKNTKVVCDKCGIQKP